MPARRGLPKTNDAELPEGEVLAPAKVSVLKAIEIKPPVVGRVEVTVRGITELICHNWSKKAIIEIEKKHAGETRLKKSPQIPDEDYRASMYNLEDGRYGFPASGVKACLVDAVRMVSDLTMTTAQRVLYVEGIPTQLVRRRQDLVVLEGEPYMREDFPRNATGVVDIRYRAAFPEWKMRFTIQYVGTILTLEQVINLVNYAGMMGLGEWRPSAPKGKSGTNGMFELFDVGEAMEEVRQWDPKQHKQITVPFTAPSR